MFIDSNIGGGIDGTTGADLAVLTEQVAATERIGFDGLWSTEVSRDPFLPLMLAADKSPTLQLGTAVAVAFARSPMTMAVAANDLQTASCGRFMLGLGSQVQAHVVRRFGMPWSSPAERMREYVQALRAIWHSWQTGERLSFEGEHYRLTLMTPMFDPGPNPFGPPPVIVAAVGPLMTAVAAEAADGLLVHGFTTTDYLAEVTLPAVLDGLTTRGRDRGDFVISFPGLVATGPDEPTLTDAIARVRHQIAFYGATPAYRSVLDRHGWGDLHTELHRMSKAGQWSEMDALIDDEVLSAFAVVGEPRQAGMQIAQRFGALVDRFTLYTPYPLDESTRAAVVEGVRGSSRPSAGYS